MSPITFPRVKEGDPLMPMLFVLGQHPALVAALRRLHAGERLFVYLDDVYVVTTPDRVGAVLTILSEELWRHSRIRIHGRKTSVERSRHPSSGL